MSKKKNKHKQKNKQKQKTNMNSADPEQIHKQEVELWSSRFKITSAKSDFEIWNHHKDTEFHSLLKHTTKLTHTQEIPLILIQKPGGQRGLCLFVFCLCMYVCLFIYLFVCLCLFMLTMQNQMYDEFSFISKANLEKFGLFFLKELHIVLNSPLSDIIYSFFL